MVDPVETLETLRGLKTLAREERRGQLMAEQSRLREQIKGLLAKLHALKLAEAIPGNVTVDGFLEQRRLEITLSQRSFLNRHLRAAVAKGEIEQGYQTVPKNTKARSVRTKTYPPAAIEAALKGIRKAVPGS